MSNVNELYVLGKKYFDEKDYPTAVKLYLMAAEQNCSDAAYDLGLCYENGWGVNKDLAEAMKWYRKHYRPNVRRRDFYIVCNNSCAANQAEMYITV